MGRCWSASSFILLITTIQYFYITWKWPHRICYKSLWVTNENANDRDDAKKYSDN